MAVAKAHLGLARLAESAGRFDDARKHYEAVKGVPGQPAANIAKQRGDKLKDLLVEVRMAATRPAVTASRPAEPPVTASAPAPPPE